jgi:hypothetical protein
MMVSSWILLLQALGVAPLSFDLAKLKAPDDCSAPGSGQIIVCGRQRSGSGRVEITPARDDAMPRAETGLFGSVRGNLHNEQSSVGGFVSNRIMATMTVPF